MLLGRTRVTTFVGSGVDDETCPFGIGVALMPATAATTIATTEILISNRDARGGNPRVWFQVLAVDSCCQGPSFSGL